MNHFISRSSWMWALALPVLLSACETSDPAKQSLSAGSANQAVLLMKVPPGPRFYQVYLGTYDRQKQALTDSSFGGYAVFEPIPNQAFAAKTVSPGTYAFRMFIQQQWWNACFQDDSLSFEVKPGEVVYMGEFNPGPDAAALEREAIAKHETTASSRNRHDYFENIPPPPMSFLPDKDRALAESQAFVKANMPKVNGAVRLAEYEPAKFGNGSDLFGARKICGGYYKDPIKN